MAPPPGHLKTRLDAVLRLSERKEEEALEVLAKARRATELAQAAADRALREMRKDSRGSASAAVWALDEAANQSARRQVKVAQEKVAQCQTVAQKAQAQHLSAHQKTRTLQRVADHRRGELQQELDRKERRNTDELAMIGFNREPR